MIYLQQEVSSISDVLNSLLPVEKFIFVAFIVIILIWSFFPIKRNNINDFEDCVQSLGSKEKIRNNK